MRGTFFASGTHQSPSHAIAAGDGAHQRRRIFHRELKCDRLRAQNNVVEFIHNKRDGADSVVLSDRRAGWVVEKPERRRLARDNVERPTVAVTQARHITASVFHFFGIDLYLAAELNLPLS